MAQANKHRMANKSSTCAPIWFFIVIKLVSGEKFASLMLFSLSVPAERAWFSAVGSSLARRPNFSAMHVVIVVIIVARRKRMASKRKPGP
jgi:hypothetical protein